ncbi:cation-translocating P-type ATPase [Methanobacterium alcaliphilum]|uniref:cation-translocating P-type ATPase n=1 Tax=Methanobacterium alcaliphilum TaxID=392018 RepID=UPI002009E234|nr:cation-translocating P-type ATPase [Methanobacterium alcaliphilum]MCK9151281.1 cation-translocating P-type ATPase [Methanobacterium alcaliphilum]
MDNFDLIDIEKISGLSESEAVARLEKYGYNELPSTEKRGFLDLMIDVIKEPMFLLLITCGSIYFILGDLQEGLMLMGFVVGIIAITFYQERKTENTLEALRDLSSPRAQVIRDGQRKRIAGREVVQGDILILEEGDRVPADAVVLSCTNLMVNESLLTGESVPVRKISCGGVIEMDKPGGDGIPSVYSGTMIVQGQGLAQAINTGLYSEMGKIGKTLKVLKTEDTPLQKESRALVMNMAIIGIFLCLLVIIAYGITRFNWINGFLAGITLAMAILPEEIPVVLTIFLALGAWRISQERVLTRRSHAIQAIGSCTVLCVDKTGTLTINDMIVSKIFAHEQFCDIKPHSNSLPENFHELVEFSILASQRDPFDPMEKSIKKLGSDTLSNTEHLHDDWSIIREYPLSTRLLAMSHVWNSPDKKKFIIAAKGAPEAIFDLCHFNEKQIANMDKNVALMAGEGLRVLAVAKASFTEKRLPGEQHDFVFKFLGLVGFLDPVRPNVKKAVQQCYDAGIQVVMITGDYIGTAKNIARKIGLDEKSKEITGIELNEMTDEELKKEIKEINIFARVVPEQKLRIVEAFKSHGEVVAMTGDGVNDAPALKSAQIGISMGGRGTDVAREASSLVLLDDDFFSIVSAVKMGRRIFDNIKKATAYIFAVHIPIVGMSLLPVLFQWPLVLFPVHIVFLELIIDPACSIVFEAEKSEANIMNRPPKSLKEPIFQREMMGLSILQGISVLIIVLLVYLISLALKQEENVARAMTFTTLIIANLSLILTNLSWSKTIIENIRSPNPALWWVIGGALAFLLVVLYIPYLQKLFSFGNLQVNDIIICFLSGIISILWFEVLKKFKKFN